MAMVELPLAPFRGFRDSATRIETPGNCLTSASVNWLVSRGVLTPRAGSAIVVDTLSGGVEVAGLLEASWGALARRMYALRLPSAADGMPTWAVLYIDEADGEALLAWLSTNGTDAVRVIGQEYGSFHYPSSGEVTLRAMPHVWETPDGGQAFGRLVDAYQRRRLLAGSRGIVQRGSEVAWPGYDSAPGRWNGRWNDSAAAGTEAVDCGPLGMVQPLQMPVLSRGESQGTTAGTGPWKAVDAFCYTCCFENEDGELSMFPVPRLPNGPWPNHPGWGYFRVNSGSTTLYYDKVIWRNIPVGPPGTRYVHLLRTAKVDASEGSPSRDAPNFPEIGNLYFCGRVPNGVTVYDDENGNDNYLDNDPRIARLTALAWPPRGRYMGRSDGHYLIGDLRPNPYALLVCPWYSGTHNYAADDEDLYTETDLRVAVTPDKLVLYNSTTEETTEIELAGKTMQQVVDELVVTKGANEETVSMTWDFDPSDPDPSVWGLLTCVANGAWSDLDIPVGSEVVLDGAIRDNVTIVEIVTAGDAGTPAVVRIDSPLPGPPFSRACTDLVDGETVTFLVPTDSADTTGDFGAQMVPGADSGEMADELMRTRVQKTATWLVGSTSLVLDSVDDAEHISVGMMVTDPNGSLATGTRATAVDTDTGIVTLSDEPLMTDSGSVTFASDTGDYHADLGHGYIRTYGNSLPVALPWRRSYLDRFRRQRQSLIFSGADPGHAQYALHSWYVDNRRQASSDMGLMMGFADLGRAAAVFFTGGRQVLINTRTGETHNDSDYSLVTASAHRGCRSPWSIVEGTGWAVFLGDDGLFGCDAGGNEVLLSRDIYDPERPAGERGQLEYAIGQCLIASELETPGGTEYALACSLRGSVLCVHYKASAASTYMDREIRYDFGESAGRNGMAELLRADGSPYGWSAPLTLPGSCSVRLVTADGDVSFSARDTNAGTGDGRVEQVDSGRQDDGEPVIAIGYTGMATEPGGQMAVPQFVLFVGHKSESGLSLAVATDPETDPTEAEWVTIPLPASGNSDYIRALESFPARARRARSALTFRVSDDGSGSRPSVVRLTPRVEPQEGNI